MNKNDYADFIEEREEIADIEKKMAADKRRRARQDKAHAKYMAKLQALLVRNKEICDEVDALVSKIQNGMSDVK